MALLLGPTAAAAASGPRTGDAKPQTADPLPADPQTPRPQDQWPLTFLRADRIWAVTQGADVTVGLVDSGVSPLGDTTPNLLAGADFSSGHDQHRHRAPGHRRRQPRHDHGRPDRRYRHRRRT